MAAWLTGKRLAARPMADAVRLPRRNGLLRFRCPEISAAKVSLNGVYGLRERLEAPIRGRTKPWADVVSAHPWVVEGKLKQH